MAGSFLHRKYVLELWHRANLLCIRYHFPVSSFLFYQSFNLFLFTRNFRFRYWTTCLFFKSSPRFGEEYGGRRRTSQLGSRRAPFTKFVLVVDENDLASSMEPSLLDKTAYSRPYIYLTASFSSSVYHFLRLFLVALNANHVFFTMKIQLRTGFRLLYYFHSQ